MEPSPSRESLQREKERQWRERVEAWRSSGQQQDAFCRANGLAASTFSYWKSELARREQIRMGEAAPSQTIQADGPESPAGQGLGWQQVPWPPASPATGVATRSAEDRLEVVLPSGWSIRLSPQFEAESLRRLLAVLEVVRC
jgi:hypothetical protein